LKSTATAGSGVPGPSTRIIELGVLSLVLSLLFARGTFHQALDILAIGVLLKGIGAERPLMMPPSARWALGAIALIWCWGVIPNQGQFWQTGNGLIWLGLVLVGVLQVPDRLFSKVAWRDLADPLLAAFVVFNGVADGLYQGPLFEGRGYPGLFSNIHYLSEYVVLTAPALMLAVLKNRGGLRYLYLAVLIGDLFLLLISKSRPGFLAAVASALVLIPLVAPVARLMIAGGMTLILGTLYFGDIGHFSERVDDLFINLRWDERAEIWLQVFDMLIGNSQMQWLFGHGLGQFLMDFHSRGVEQQFRVFLSPHNFVFEILYSHGILGLLLIMGAVLTLLGGLVRALGRGANAKVRLEGYVLVSMLTASLVHGVFTIPFFSRDFLLPFGIVVSLVLLYIERARKAPSLGR
jgi:O-antigen ligase